MISYAQSLGLTPFDWNEFLSRKEITYQDWKFLYQKAKLWETCACGNLSVKIPRDSFGSGRPEDPQLFALGIAFTTHILKCNAREAKYTLIKIEELGNKLIEITNK